jgi:hypothetical protein
MMTIMPAALYRLKTCCHDTWDDFCVDLAIASYKNILRWFLFCCSFAFLVTILCVSPYWGTGSDYCRPDNKFDISNQYYDVWRPSNPFEVTIKFGKLSFGTAKLIDVIWDVVGSISLSCYLNLGSTFKPALLLLQTYLRSHALIWFVL